MAYAIIPLRSHAEHSCFVMQGRLAYKIQILFFFVFFVISVKSAECEISTGLNCWIKITFLTFLGN